MSEVKVIPVSSVVFRKDLYPRIEHSQQRAQQYAEILDLLPPIELNQHNELIDGNHRLIAHRLKERETINAIITETKSDTHLLLLANRRNRSHGLQTSDADKKKLAIRFYLDESTWSEFSSAADRAQVKKDIAKELSCSISLIRDATSDVDQKMREERRETIEKMYLECYTTAEIAEEIGLKADSLAGEKSELSLISTELVKSSKVQFSDDTWTPPIYNVWSFAKKTNETSHFGNTEQRITENLLYLYTNPLDIVIDPFGGGGSTLDICKVRGRRCWISDRKPKAGMEDKLRTLDITSELPPMNKRWSDVSLVYLDPPYWAQAKGEYSQDAEDLANYESADKFHEAMVDVVKRFADKLSSGAHIALIIQPTQWRSPERVFVDHVMEIIKGVGNKKLLVENRVSCPYSTEQCNPQMVTWAKENKKLLVLSRELIVWKKV